MPQPRFLYKQLAPDRFIRFDSLRNSFDIVTGDDVPPLAPMNPDALRLSLNAQHDGHDDEFDEFTDEDCDEHFSVDVDAAGRVTRIRL
ncbi:MAG: hypothetical protein U0792_00640 [Gemmataceae bacterium]